MALLWPWVLQFFVFYRSVTEKKLLFTVSFDHPECWYYYPFFVVVKYCTFWPLSVNEKRNSTVPAFSNWVDAATNFYRQPPLYSVVAKQGPAFFACKLCAESCCKKSWWIIAFILKRIWFPATRGAVLQTMPEAQRTQKLTPWLGLNLSTTWHHLH